MDSRFRGNDDNGHVIGCVIHPVMPRFPMPSPTELTVHQKSRLFDIAFEDGSAFSIPFELMRVYSPSAEVKGHGPGQEVLQVGKREVGINGVEPVGNYGVKPLFTDGHATGIFTWDYLYKLGSEQQTLWQDYM